MSRQTVPADTLAFQGLWSLAVVQLDSFLMERKDVSFVMSKVLGPLSTQVTLHKLFNATIVVYASLSSHVRFLTSSHLYDALAKSMEVYHDIQSLHRAWKQGMETSICFNDYLYCLVFDVVPDPDSNSVLEVLKSHC